jgi:hypothetical protein
MSAPTADDERLTRVARPAAEGVRLRIPTFHFRGAGGTAQADHASQGIEKPTRSHGIADACRSTPTIGGVS